MAVLRVRDNIVVLQTMIWPDEVRSADFANLGDVGSATERELSMATMLIDSLSGDYDPDEFQDDYSEAVHDMVEAKLSGGEVTARAGAPGHRRGRRPARGAAAVGRPRQGVPR